MDRQKYEKKINSKTKKAESDFFLFFSRNDYGKGNWGKRGEVLYDV
jgi:hypothetical protein